MKIAFKPIVHKKCKILILGTMPGEKSLDLGQYYGHNGNHFWKIIFSILEIPFETDYKMRKKILLRNNIALWDVLHSCEREGSLDSNIKNERVNLFGNFYPLYPKITCVFFASKKAEELYIKHIGKDRNKIYGRLPSPSGANASMSFDKKVEKWKIILKYLKNSPI